MKKLIIFVILASICLGEAYAQKRRSRKKKAKEEVVEKTPQQKLYDELLYSTAQVMFIDSLVVDKATFLSQIPIPEELGIMNEENTDVSYTNEFSNTRITATGDTLTGRHLYISHKYGNEWNEPRQMNELTNKMADYPFMMADGVTLYFSAEGEGTVGGKDIFRTTYNSDDLTFYEATNMGLPFNSPANDYLLAISDLDEIGWLVSDRNQPEGKVCIYTFEPTPQRKVFAEGTDSLTLLSYAKIEHIKDTWQFGDRNAALERVANLSSRTNTNKANDKIEFVVNDNKTYTSIADFKSEESKKDFQAIQHNKQKLAQLTNLLNSTREAYAQASNTKKHGFGRQIIELEKETETLTEDIAKAEKALRNREGKQ